MMNYPHRKFVTLRWTTIVKSSIVRFNLDIFASRAKTREAQLQVEVAQLKYMMPRLIGLNASLSRQAGGIGSKGPGGKEN